MLEQGKEFGYMLHRARVSEDLMEKVPGSDSLMFTPEREGLFNRYKLPPNSRILTQGKLAELIGDEIEQIGLDQTAISNYENGSRHPQRYRRQPFVDAAAKLMFLTEEARDELMAALRRDLAALRASPQENQRKVGEAVSAIEVQVKHMNAAADQIRDAAAGVQAQMPDVQQAAEQVRQTAHQIRAGMQGMQDAACTAEQVAGKIADHARGVQDAAGQTRHSVQQMQGQVQEIQAAAAVSQRVAETIQSQVEQMRADAGPVLERLDQLDADVRAGNVETLGAVTGKMQEGWDNIVAALGQTRETIEGLDEGLEQLEEHIQETATDILDAVSHGFEDTRRDISQVHDTVARIAYQVQEIWSAMYPKEPPAPPTTAVAVINENAQRALLALICLASLGFLLAALQVSGQTALIAYTLLGLGLVMWLGYRRGRPFRILASPEYTGRGPRFAELLFVSLFVVLGAPLLQSALTGIDIYGFFTIPGLAGTVWPIVLSLGVNFGIALAATVVFELLWLRAYSRADTGSAFAQAAMALVPSFATAYIPAAVFGNIGYETYLLDAFVPLLAAFLLIIVCSDPRVRLNEWTARVLLLGAGVTIGILFLVAMAGMFLWLFVVPDTVPAGNHLRSWVVDFSALGYAAEEFVARGNAGFVWAIITAMGYLLVAVGATLIRTIYGYQIAPHHREQVS